MRHIASRFLHPAVFVAVLVVWLGAPAAQAQVVAGSGYSDSYRVSDYLGAPGNYGMSYGFASYGMPQTYSVFSAYPGPSYGTNYPPYGILPGRYGVGLWRPGYVAPGYVYGASYYYPSALQYRTFPVGNGTGGAYRSVSPPPVGVYAPALGPSTLYGW
ncbi:MAG TPA: hypothetical protein VKA15_16600 [Isosphaeraceae bacterium]|nr:hypothetical protein [Isosphaeraceae bacterium]